MNRHFTTAATLAGFAVLAVATPSYAQDPTGGSLPAETQDATAPVLKTHPSPDYPPQALHDRVEGTVGLELKIGEDGTVESVVVRQPAGHGFDEAAVAAVKGWTFEPARRGNAPLRSTLQLSLPFTLPSGAAPAGAPTTSTAAPVAATTGAPVAEQHGTDQSTLVIAERAVPPANAASDSNTSHAELMLRPRFKTENVLEAVPGLFSVQHAGGGKAQQYFLRGFDADHGTDIAFSIDGAPINMVSHGHGQGFSDLHFIIPETIESLDATKGPYSVRAGDFATAGSVNFRMADHAAESTAKVEVGPWGHTRLVALESPDLGKDWRMLVAAEVFHDNGPFIHPDDFDRFNGYVKVTHALDDRSEASLTLTGYGGSWNASGVLPARAVCGEGDGTPTPSAYSGSHCLSRWDSLDPTQGGSTQRVQAIAEYKRRFAKNTDLVASAYGIRYGFKLFANDGIAASFQPDGILYGSQVEQDDSRLVVGGKVEIVNRYKFDDIEVKSTFGISVRNDGIHSELHRTEGRTRLDGIDANIPGPIADSNIDETEIGIYAEENVHLTKWLRFVAGIRGDRIDADISNQSSAAVDQVSGPRGQGQFSPKASVIVSPAKFVDLFANYGRGFHSNDARTNFTGSLVTMISTATGYETGAIVRPIKGLSLSAVAFLLDLQSELTIDGDDASTSAAGPTRRYGGEFTGRYNFNDYIYADAAFTVTHARYTDQADINAGTALVSLAPVRTFFAGVGARKPIGAFTVYGSARVKSMSDRPGLEDGSLTATGFTLFDADLGVRWKFLEVGADMLNIGNTEWREGQFAVNSRLPGEGANPPAGMSFTPGIPRTVLGHAAVYW
jgi:TonB family protein